MNDAAFKVFEQHKEIQVVSNQASDWEPEKARQITATVLQQHPDLCAIFGHWDVHTMGAGNAVKDAGKADDVLVYATGGGDDVACKAVEDGILDRIWSYDADGQGRDAGTMIDLLLQGAAAADGSMLSAEFADEDHQGRRRLRRQPVLEDVGRLAGSTAAKRLAAGLRRSLAIHFRRNAFMAAEIDFDSLPRQPVPRFVVSPRRDRWPTCCRRAGSRASSRSWRCSSSSSAYVLTTDGYFSASNLRNLAQYAADGGLVVLALLIVVAVGGIDLSVGSNFAMSAFAALFCFHILELPVPAVLALTPGDRHGRRHRQRRHRRAARLRRAAHHARHHDHRARPVHARLAGAAGRDLDERRASTTSGTGSASRRC